MFNRAELKEKAKKSLSINFWTLMLLVFLVPFVLGIIEGQATAGGVVMSVNGELYIRGANPAISFLFMVITFLYGIFITNYELKAAKSDEKLSIGEAWKDIEGTTIIRYLLAVLLTSLIIFVGFLLFIIPGFIASYGLFFVPHIILDNPGIGVMDAVRKSWDMTKGAKLDMFVLDLSFIGWYLLGIITCGLAFIYVVPYIALTQTHLYYALKN